MFNIKSCNVLFPANVKYDDKSVMVYIDYNSKSIYLLENIENEEEFIKNLSEFVFKKTLNTVPVVTLPEEIK